jgi:primosomal protein N' (replication factor Y)
MDADTTRNKGSHEDIINRFKNHEFDILLGTQMISKGLDFPLVTLVGVINADTTLNMPDFRSGERTFQLLNQVAGRAGRADLPGSVVIQGFNIDHYSIICAKNHDYISFYNEEMNIRKKLKYPLSM